MVILAVLALLLSLAAAGLAAALFAVVRRLQAQQRADVPADVLALRREVAALQAEGRQAVRHVSVVRYDAFGDQGGQLSWSLALLDDEGAGVVLSSIHGRSEARTYAKSVTGWVCTQQPSPEEEQAVAGARPR